MAEQRKSEKFAYLDQLSTERLEELIRADIETPGNPNNEVIFHILEVIKKREREHPTGRLVDVNEAWAEFQQYYNIPEGDGLSLYPTECEHEKSPEDKYTDTIAERPQSDKVLHLRPVLKVAGIAAALVVVIFGTLITVQAAGVDVFGAIGRWTEETFHFVISPPGAAQSDTNTASNLAQYSVFQACLVDCGITENLTPTWYPEGFEAAETKVISNGYHDNIFCEFNGPEDGFFRVQVLHYYSTSDIHSHIFEKDDTPVEEYTGNGKTFYILSNIDSTTATWSDGSTLILSIVGTISRDDIKSMIESIG